MTSTVEGRNREAWLAAASERLTERFESAGLLGARTRIGVGFTSKGGKTRRIGECWAESASADATREIIISPVLDDARQVLATLLHERIHAALPADAKHGPAFKRVAVACGLEGKMTATVPGAALLPVLDDIAADLGDYPHAALSVLLGGPKTQTTRLVKVECPDCAGDEPYIARMSRKALERGAPTCPCGTVMVEA